jgi:hypothetical protein
MLFSTRQIPVLSTCCCLLIMLASGDDFNLARVALPDTFASAEPSPLDDPNTDFLASSCVRGAKKCYGGNSHATVSQKLHCWVHPLPTADNLPCTSGRPVRHADLNLPLLC